MKGASGQALVARKLAAIFTDEEQRVQARQMLAAVDHSEHGQDPQRVELALLKVCGGTLAGLQKAIDQLQVDFRDVLVAAEYPNQGNYGYTRDADVSAALAKRDLEQYVRWLEGGDPEEGGEES